MYCRLFLVLALLALAHASRVDEEKCNCEDDVCVIVPPADATAPCYQGSNSDTDKCFKTDPLLVDGVVKTCGTCEKFGFSTYLRNDPLYKTMSLYQRDAAMVATTATARAPADCIKSGQYCTPGFDVCCKGTCPYSWDMRCP